MKITTIIFDMFGVICSEIAPIWLRKYISEEKLEELKDIHFVPIDKGEISEEELFTNLAKLAGISPEKVREEFDELIILNEETIKIINGLKINYKIGLCSNSPSKFIRNILRINNLEKLFEVIVVSSEHGIAKPDHKIYQTSNYRIFPLFFVLIQKIFSVDIHIQLLFVNW